MKYIIFMTYFLILSTYWNCIRQRHDMKYLYKPAILKKNKTTLNKILLFLLENKGKHGFSRINFYSLCINNILFCVAPIWLIVVYKNKYYEINDFNRAYFIVFCIIFILHCLPGIVFGIQSMVVHKYRKEHQDDKMNKHSGWRNGGRFK